MAQERTKAEQRKWEIKRQRILRWVIQLIFAVAMPGAFVAGFSGVKYVFLWIGTGAELQFSSFIKALIGLSVVTILWGRFFCGYACSFGTLGDMVYQVSTVLQQRVLHRKKPLTLPDKVIQLFQKLKYVNLLVILLMCTIGFYQELSGTSAWDVFSLISAGRFQFAGYGIGVGSLAVILLGMAIQERFFCQFLCPMGAYFSLLPVLPWTALRRNPDHCIPTCQACRKQCPVRMKLDDSILGNGECIACEKCTVICPRGNITQPLRHWSLVLIKGGILFGMGAALGFCRFF